MLPRLKIILTIVTMAGCSVLCQCQPLATGLWSKFSVRADGVYRIDYNLLKKAGFNPDTIDPRNIQLFSNGTGMLPQPNNATRRNKLAELAIFVSGESDGKFDKQDFILFFGLGPDISWFDVTKQIFSYEHNLYSDKNFYFITAASSAGKRIELSNNVQGNFPVITQFNDFGYYENDQYNILKSGRDWFGEQFNTSTDITLQFALDGIADNTPIKLVSGVMTQSYDAPSSFRIQYNNTQVLEQSLGTIPAAQYSIKGLERIDTIQFNSSQVGASLQQAQNIKYQYQKAASGISTGYLNFFIFSMQRKLALYGASTIFTSSQSLANATSQFRVSGIAAGTSIWDVTDHFSVKDQQFSTAGTDATFSVPTDILKKFIVFRTADIPAAVFEQQVTNQNLSALTAPDLLIVTHPDFKSEAVRLADFRQQHNQVSVQTVTTQEIYNEYSGGKQDVSAIRDFVKDVYSKGGKGLDNLLLFGRCSYDYKNRVIANTNFVPTYESRNSLSPLETYSSDDYFAFLEISEGRWAEYPADYHTMEIGVGRLSVTTLKQASDVVDKLIEYETSSQRFGDWRANMLFVADDGDVIAPNIHQEQADELAESIDNLHPEFTTKKTYLDQFKQATMPSGQVSPDARSSLDKMVDEGILIVNFTGHGSENVWTEERILDSDLVGQWKNAPRYPLFVTATCEFGRHDDPFEISTGELLLLQPKGGGIGLVTTARPVNSSTNFELNKSFYKALFVKKDGAYRDMGAVFRETKNNSMSGVANRNFSLIGDPSMHLAFGTNEIVLDKITTLTDSDTLKALSTVTVQASVYKNGVKRTDFNGDAVVTVYDKPVSRVTLGDENPPFSYVDWTNRLFSGKVSVAGGTLSSQFIIPKDQVAHNHGKITFYAFNQSEDASGAAPTVSGGTEAVTPVDQNGPDVLKLFIGDTTFVSGSIASPNTTLLVHVHDEHGIDISSLGGADGFIAILDDTLTFSLSNFYTADKDSYRQGTVTYPLKNLVKGNHSIVVRVSDTFGNHTSASIDFVVTDSNLTISDFYNYPNPFHNNAQTTDGETTFGFSHNRPGEDLAIELTIVSLSGQIVDFEQFTVYSSLTTVTLGKWAGTKADGNKLSSGIYLGKLSVRSLLDGSKNQHFTKLIIFN